MIKTENHMGTIEITETYFANLIGNTVSSCFGVVGMANSNTRQQLRDRKSTRLNSSHKTESRMPSSA